MPEFELSLGEGPAADAYEAAGDFVQGYVQAMFFTSTGPDNAEEQLGEGTSVAELSIEAWRVIKADCAKFTQTPVYVAAMGDNGYGNTDFEEDQAGRDFWFTRNGHGVGFWDRDEDVYGPHQGALDTLAKTFRNIDLYRGGDGKLYLM